MANLEPRYDHNAIEGKMYELWEKSGYFNPDNLPVSRVKGQGSRRRRGSPRVVGVKSFTIIMPPPNANGSLHVGHAVFVTLQDILIRFWRMRGRKTLWLPGADHAGFETQVVYDKKLDKEGRNRYQIPREELWREIWNFTQESKKVMERQLRKLGASCDWSREKFTLDQNIVREAQSTFARMHEDGLIYRGERIVNWCPKHQTSLSDIENQFREQVDSFYYLKYGPFTIGTARPETKFGDKYVVMHPSDERYKKYKNGEKINLEWINGPITATVVKDKVVDMKFGTGVMTITPWHDAADFEIAERHGLQKEQIIDFNGRLLPIAGEFAGMKISEARPKIIEKLKAKDLLVKVDEEYLHNVRVCYKCGTPIEPQIRKQWFVRMTAPPHAQGQKSKVKSQKSGKALRDLGIEAVKSGKIKFFPKNAEKIYFHWLREIRDWNISRQIVWGIRIPAWFCLGCEETKINPKIKSRWFIVRHGETDYNKQNRFQGAIDIPLNETGIAQARESAKKLRNKKIDLIITSPLIRARQTAEIIAKECGAEIIVENDIRERSFGEWDGMEHDEVKKKYSAESFSRHLDPSFRVPGGESWEEITTRMWNAFQKHHAIHRHKNVVIVGHGGVARTLQNKIKGIPIIESKLAGNAEIWELELADPCPKCGGHFYEQDPDVFDTWFSSGQWPFLTLGFQEAKSSSMSKVKSQKLKVKSDFDMFYPTDVMETGHDILFFWVARMIMLGLYRTGKIPFKTVYLHGLVRDKDRQKMSKSKGNVIDPLGVAEIYGTDALRMALVVGNTPGSDIVISEEKIRGYRNFATKIWNIARFVLMNKPESGVMGHRSGNIVPTTEDRKNLKQLAKIKFEITKHIEKFEFHLASEKVYHYIWHTFADKIIEKYKPRLRHVDIQESFAPSGRQAKKNLADQAAAYQTLETILIGSLKMLHPFMPFITEEIYGKLHSDGLLMVENW